MTPLARVRVVLVRPHYAGNLGSCARAAKNFGATDLVLVAPLADRNSTEARMMAVHAADVLAGARVVGTLAEAIGDCGYALATSGEVGGLVRQGFTGPPHELLPPLLDTADAQPAAVVFGPEPSGLTLDEMALCRGAILIPTDELYPSMNLAQAVAVVMYELRRLALARVPPPPVDPLDLPATQHELTILYARLEDALTRVRFLWDHRAEGLFHVVRQVIGRAKPTAKELRVLHGVASQLCHVAGRYGVVHPREGRPKPPA